MSDFDNLVEMVDFASKEYGNKKAFNYLKDGQWISISNYEFANDIKLIGLALKDFGLKKSKGFGIFANPSPFWLKFNYGCMAAGAVSVPMFYNISIKNLLFEIEDANIEYSQNTLTLGTGNAGNWDINNLYVLAYIYDVSSYEILQVEEKSLLSK